MDLLNVCQKVICLILVSFLCSTTQFAVEEDVDVFSSREISGPKERNEAFLPKINSVYIKTKIRFRFSRTKVTAKITNPHKKLSQNLTFTLRLPLEAFISRFEMRVNNGPKVLRATTVRIEDAKKMYEFAIEEGRSVTLGYIEQSEFEYNEMHLKFIVAAKKSILFSVIYEERLPRIDDKYESVNHLVPDYFSNKTVFRLEVEIDENLPITSVAVPIEDLEVRNATITQDSATKATIIWSNTDPQGEIVGSYPKNEFIVSYSLENEMSTGHVLLRNGYFIHFFVPDHLEPLRKHVIFILDVSDSMTGKKMNQTVSAMVEILDELKPDDFFNIVTFSTSVEVWSCIHGEGKDKLFPFPANAQCKDEARWFIENLQPQGSTNAHDALMTGLQIARNVSVKYAPPKVSEKIQIRPRTHKGFKASLRETLPSEVQSLMIFFTDGEPTSGVTEKPIILSKVKILNANMSVPIFSLAFGRHADFAFLSKLSTRNGGIARKIYEEADPSFQLADFYREISSPVLVNLSFKYDSRMSGGRSSVVSSGYSMAFQGQEILTLGRLNDLSDEDKRDNISAKVTGKGRSGTLVFSIPLKDCTKNGNCDAETDFDDKCVEKLFIYLTLKQMIQQVFVLESEKYYNSDVEKELERLKEKVTELALEHSLITPYTAMIMRTKSIQEEEMDGHDASHNPGTIDADVGVLITKNKPGSDESPNPTTSNTNYQEVNLKKEHVSSQNGYVSPRFLRPLTPQESMQNYERFEIQRNTTLNDTLIPPLIVPASS